jgi:hypothetical protein
MPGFSYYFWSAYYVLDTGKLPWTEWATIPALKDFILTGGRRTVKLPSTLELVSLEGTLGKRRGSAEDCVYEEGGQKKHHWEGSVWTKHWRRGSKPGGCLRRSAPGRGTSKCKGPEAGLCPQCLRSSKEVSVARPWGEVWRWGQPSEGRPIECWVVDHCRDLGLYPKMGMGRTSLLMTILLNY